MKNEHTAFEYNVMSKGSTENITFTLSQISRISALAGFMSPVPPHFMVVTKQRTSQLGEN